MKITLTQALMLEPGDYIAMMMHNGTVLRKQILCIDLKVGKISLRRKGLAGTIEFYKEKVKHYGKTTVWEIRYKAHRLLRGWRER
jgi:hypothetical protein